MRWPGYVFGPGPDGSCDDLTVGGATVDVDPATGRWRMWYYCRNRAYERPAPATLGTGFVALATSDDGRQWTRVVGPAPHGAVLAPSDDPDAFDHSHVGLTDLTITHDGRLMMWTFGGDRTVVKTGLPHLGDVTGLALRCGLATSEDGLNWQRHYGTGPGGALFDILPDELYAGWPNALPQPDGSYILHYTAPSPDMAQFHSRAVRFTPGKAVERLGPLEWVDGQSAEDCLGMVTRHVIPDPEGQSRWLMVYTGLDAHHRRSISLARSDDGLRWARCGPPILRPAPAGQWDDHGVAANRLVVTTDALYLYYFGFSSLTATAAPRGIGLAIAPRDGAMRFARV